MQRSLLLTNILLSLSISSVLTAPSNLHSNLEHAKEPENIVKIPKNIVKITKDIVKIPKDIVKKPENIVKESENIVKEAENIVKETENIVKEPEIILKERDDLRHDHRPYGAPQNPMHVPFITNRPTYVHAPLENQIHHQQPYPKPNEHQHHHRGFFGTIWHVTTLPARLTWRALTYPVRLTWRLVSNALDL